MSEASPPPPTSEIEHRVTYAETDQMGVVYHANYLVWCRLPEHVRELLRPAPDPVRS